jgi:signal transduction histidine kinase
MKIGTKGRLATTTLFATVLVLSAMMLWANSEVDAADHQRRRTSEIARALNDLRLVTFEYILYRTERARLQERRAASRLDDLLSAHPFDDPEAMEILADLRERNAVTQNIFRELVASPSGSGVRVTAQSGTALERFEAQLSRKLLVLQQESLVDAFRLSDYSTARIGAAQRRVVLVFFGGLVLIVITAAGVGWLIHRGLLAPIGRLRHATREIAAGNWDHKLDLHGNDEIADMSRNFDAMTSALKASFAQVERSNQELAALNREIEAFSYSVSHDLRAPLRSMNGFSLALLEDYEGKLDDQGRDYLHRIRAASERMGRLIDELLGLSRVTRYELAVRAVDLSAIAREIAASLAQQQPDRSVRWEIEDDIVVQADKSLAQIAMQNLLENSWKFTGKTADAVIRVGRTEHEGQPVCFVSDNGVGFDMTYADRLFGAFQRLHHESDFTGTGIGLAIVHRIIRRHEGLIWAQAKPGQGATFYFTFGEQQHAQGQRGHPPGGGQPG